MKTSHKFKHLLPLGLCLSLAFNVPKTAFAQGATQIEVTVVLGEGDINKAHQRVARDPVVKVEDQDHQPLEGAAVVFTLPISGASGEFGNGSKTLIVKTDKDGLATAHGIKTNQVDGTLQIYVNASYHGLRARTIISQTNTGGTGAATAKKGSNAKLWIILAVVGAAAAGGAVAAGGGNGSSASSGGPTAPPAPVLIGITPGSGSIGPPPR